MILSELVEFLTGRDVGECLAGAAAAQVKLPEVESALARVTEERDVLRGTVATLEERLRQAMLRDSAKAQRIGVLEAEVTDLTARLSDMREHPAVRKATRDRLKAQADAILAQAAALDDPPEVNPKAEDETASEGDKGGEEQGARDSGAGRREGE